MAFGSQRARAAAALVEIEQLESTDSSPQEVVEEIVACVVGAIDTHAFFLGATDPNTGLCIGTATYNFDERALAPGWRHELLVPDYNKFADLTTGQPVADLREATGGKLSRSARYRLGNAIADLGDELRATLPAGGHTWGDLQLNRHTGDRPFSDADRDFLTAAAPLAGAALRHALLAEPVHTDLARGPGVVVVDADGTVVSATAEARAWLADLAVGHGDFATFVGMHPELLLMPLTTLSRDDAPSRQARLRTPGGAWLTAHASRLEGSGHVAIVIEPAKATEVAPIVVKAYRLTEREVQIAQLVAQGLSTDEIAFSLFLSRHTVRDYLKTIFEKVGVTSGGELTSKLFTERYRGPLAPTLRTDADRVPASVAAATERA